MAAQDAKQMPDLVSKYGLDLSPKIILPLIKQNAGSIEVIVATLEEFSLAVDDQRISAELTRGLLIQLSAEVIVSFRRQCQKIQPKAELPGPFLPRSRSVSKDRARWESPKQPEPPRLKTIIAQQVNTLVCCFERTQLSKEAETLMHALADETKTADLSAFDCLFLPLLRLLPPALEIQNSSLGFQDLYQSVLSTYLNRYVGCNPAIGPESQRVVVFRTAINWMSSQRASQSNVVHLRFQENVETTYGSSYR